MGKHLVCRSASGRVQRWTALLLSLLFTAAAGAGTIREIRISGNSRIDQATILYYVHSKAGGEYDEAKLKEDFRRLWDTGFFSDVKLDEKDGEKGKIVTFFVKERPVVKSIEYRGNKAVTTSAIQEELRKEKVELSVNTVYDPATAYRARRIIEKVLKDKGQQFGTVAVKLEPVGASDAQLVFAIDEGPKARIEKIAFTGNAVVSDAALRRAMKEQKQHWLFSFITSKDVYSKEKFDEDMDRVRMKYWELGRLRVQVDPPQLRAEDYRTFLFHKERKKLFFEIPVQEGPEYKTASIKIEGNSVFPTERLMQLVQLKVGERYDVEQRNGSLKDIRNLYAERGYFYAQPGTQDLINDESKTVDLTIHIEENQLCVLDRLEFHGNVTTKDKVLRREFQMSEGEVFNSKRFEDSLKRIQQLGLVEIAEEPKIEPDANDKSRLDVTVEVKESQRNQVQLGGGVSQVDGTFATLSYSTTNFLGAGENFDVELQGGRRTTNLRLSITEPYFLDRPIQLGFDAFKSNTRYDLQGYRQQATGGSIIFGFPLGASYWRNSYVYSYQTLRYSDFSDSIKNNPAYQLMLRSGPEGSLTYTLFRNTVDNPLNPYSGNRWSFTNRVAGGPLGGDYDYYRPDLELIRYQPISKKTNLGMRFQLQYAKAFHGQDLPARGTIYLGGEESVRGFPYGGVGPRDKDGNVIGGNKSLLFNIEYYIPIAGPFKLVLFADAGNVWSKDENFNLGTLRSSTGIEGRFFIPMFRVPFRLIAAYNPGRAGPTGSFKGDDKFSFKFSIGTTF